MDGLERTTMRFSITFILSCGLAIAAGDPRTATYISGNIEGVAANTGATIDVSGEKALKLNAGEKALEVPYASIANAEAGEVTIVTPESEPLYKVWKLHKRILNRKELQQVKVDFKAASGENRSMTLEVERATADQLLWAIEVHGPKADPSKQAWWGDSIWKTKRNKDQWGGAGELATRE
jgi:hypothetical protein